MSPGLMPPPLIMFSQAATMKFTCCGNSDISHAPNPILDKHKYNCRKLWTINVWIVQALSQLGIP
jgi:protein-tyrosine phosphatase